MSQVSSRVCKIRQLKKNLSNGVCKEDQKDLSECDGESVTSTKRSYGPGEDIFGKYDPDKLVEDGPTDNSTDEDEDDTEDEDEDDKEDDEEDVEDDVSEKKKRLKIRSWDVLANIAAIIYKTHSMKLWRKLWQNIQIRTYKKLKKSHMRI